MPKGQETEQPGIEEGQEVAEPSGALEAGEAEASAKQEAAAGLLEEKEASPDTSYNEKLTVNGKEIKVGWFQFTHKKGVYRISFPQVDDISAHDPSYGKLKTSKANRNGWIESGINLSVSPEDAKKVFAKAAELAKDSPDISDLYDKVFEFANNMPSDTSGARSVEETETVTQPDKEAAPEAELTEDEKEIIGYQKEYFSKGISEALSNIWVGSEDYEDIFTEAENMDEVAEEAAKVIEKAYVQGWSEEKFLEKLSEIPVRFPDEYRDQVGEEHSSLGGFLRHTGSRSLGRRAEYVYNQLISERHRK